MIISGKVGLKSFRTQASQNMKCIVKTNQKNNVRQ